METLVKQNLRDLGYVPCGTCMIICLLSCTWRYHYTIIHAVYIDLQSFVPEYEWGMDEWNERGSSYTHHGFPFIMKWMDLMGLILIKSEHI